MTEYTSEYAMPVNSILQREREGDKIVTTVFLDGQFVQFEAAVATVEAARALENGSTSNE